MEHGFDWQSGGPVRVEWCADIYRCKACGDELVDTGEAMACGSCGVVDSDARLVDYGDGAMVTNGRGSTVCRLGNSPRDWGTYDRLFHLNERLGQLLLAEPPIPSEIWELLQTEFDFGEFEREYPKPDDLTRNHIRAMCRSVRVPTRIQEKYRSTKFKCNPLRDLKRYAEKWLTIRKKLGGNAPPKLHPNALHRLREEFLMLKRPFNIMRHKPDCPGNTRTCHKSAARCRHNFPNFNYVILQLLRRQGLHKTFAPYLPQLTTPSKIRNLDALCERMWNYLGWPFTPMYKPKRRGCRGPRTEQQRPEPVIGVQLKRKREPEIKEAIKGLFARLKKRYKRELVSDLGPYWVA